MGADRLVDMMGDGAVFGVGEILQMEELLGLGDAAGGERRGLGLLVDDVVGIDVGGLLLFIVRLDHDIFLQPRRERLREVVHLRGLLAHAGDNQRRTRLIDQDGVDLVDDGEAVAALHLLAGVERHVVAQVVKAHLVVRAVGDVGGVGGLPRGLVHVVYDQAHGKAEEAVHLAHPLRVALGEVVVDRHDMDALARQRVQIGRERRDKGLALTGLHLGDAPLMQHDAADELHAVRAQAEHAVGRLAHRRERLGQDVVERLAVCQPLLERGGLGLQLGVRQRLILIGQRLDLIGDRVDGFQLPLAVSTKNLLKQSH